MLEPNALPVLNAADQVKNQVRAVLAMAREYLTKAYVDRRMIGARFMVNGLT